MYKNASAPEGTLPDSRTRWKKLTDYLWRHPMLQVAVYWVIILTAAAAFVALRFTEIASIPFGIG